jgi:hypothetical protein
VSRGEEIQVESAWWNNAASASTGLFAGELELRREILLGGTSFVEQPRMRVGVWYNGEKLARLGPELERD